MLPMDEVDAGPHHVQSSPDPHNDRCRITDVSIDLIQTPYLSRQWGSSSTILDHSDQLGPQQLTPPAANRDNGLSDISISPLSPHLSTSSCDTFVVETQTHSPQTGQQASPLTPSHEPMTTSTEKPSPIKAMPIQVMTPNGTVYILPKTPQPEIKKRRRSSRLLGSGDSSDTAARIEKASQVKHLESTPDKRHAASTSSPLGSIEVPIVDFTDEELALLSTATGYRLPMNAAAILSDLGHQELGSKLA